MSFSFVSWKGFETCPWLVGAGQGDVSAETHVIPFRFSGDIDMVSYQKKPQPLCEFLRYLAINHGLGEMKVEDHTVEQRFQTVTWTKPFCRVIVTAIKVKFSTNIRFRLTVFVFHFTHTRYTIYV